MPFKQHCTRDLRCRRPFKPYCSRDLGFGMPLSPTVRGSCFELIDKPKGAAWGAVGLDKPRYAQIGLFTLIWTQVGPN